jgi:hypothetical protein
MPTSICVRNRDMSLFCRPLSNILKSQHPSVFTIYYSIYRVLFEKFSNRQSALACLLLTHMLKSQYNLVCV